MKKYFILLALCGLLCAAARAEEPAAASGPRPAVLLLRPTAQQRKIFKQRNKAIRRLAKQYRKASAEEKPAIKAQLAQIVSDATDESMAWAQQRLAEEKNNLARWEQTLQQRQAHLDEVKAKRVDDILSGEAQRRYQLARKRWKAEMKDAKKFMK